MKQFRRIGGSVVNSTPSEVFNYESLWKRFEDGRKLVETNRWVRSTIPNPNPFYARPCWNFLNPAGEKTQQGNQTPGRVNLTAYWQVREPDIQEYFLHKKGQIPKYVCSCPDQSLRLQAAPLSDVILKKFPAEWAGILRDCKHIWAVRFIEDQIQFIDPLPNDVPLTPDIREAGQTGQAGFNPPTTINGIGNPARPSQPAFKSQFKSRFR